MKDLLSKFVGGKAETTSFSEFFKSASSGEKKKMYTKAMDQAIKSQQSVMTAGRKAG